MYYSDFNDFNDTFHTVV